MPVWESSHRAGPSPDLTIQPLDGVVGVNTCPMGHGEVGVGERLDHVPRARFSRLRPVSSRSASRLPLRPCVWRHRSFPGHGWPSASSPHRLACPWTPWSARYGRSGRCSAYTSLREPPPLKAPSIPSDLSSVNVLMPLSSRDFSQARNSLHDSFGSVKPSAHPMISR